MKFLLSIRLRRYSLVGVVMACCIVFVWAAIDNDLLLALITAATLVVMLVATLTGVWLLYSVLEINGDNGSVRSCRTLRSK